MSRIAARVTTLAFLTAAAVSACDSPGGNSRTLTVSRMPPEEAAAAAARAEESAMRAIEIFRRSFGNGSDSFSAGCFDTFELDRADLCGDDYTAHFLFEWSDCFQTSGRVLIDNLRDTVPAGGQCQAPSGYTTDHASAYDFTAQLGDRTHEAHVTVDATGLLAGDGTPREVGSDVSVHAMGTGSAGTLVYDALVDSTWTSVWNTAGVPTIVTDGSSHVHLTVLQRDYQVAATALTFREDCCHPVSGTVAVSAMVANSSFQATAVFGPNCGDATVDGTPVTLAPCGP